MKNNLFTIFTLFSVFTTYSQTKNDTIISSHYSDGLYRAEVNGKVGFMDEKKRVIIPFIYDSDTLRITGREIEYDGAENFRNGKAIVKVGDKFGIIDKNRATIVEFIYDDLVWNAVIGTHWSDDEGVLLGFKDGQSYYFDP